MKRSHPPRRKTPMPRSSKPMARGRITRKKRSAAEFRRIHGSADRVAWINAMPCVGCGVEGFTANARVCGNGGTSRKANAETIAPLCKDRIGVEGCHTKYDEHKPPFDREEAREAVQREAARIARAWRAHEERAA